MGRWRSPYSDAVSIGISGGECGRLGELCLCGRRDAVPPWGYRGGRYALSILCGAGTPRFLEGRSVVKAPSLIAAQVCEKVGHGMDIEGGFETGGHEGETGGFEAFDVFSENWVFDATGEAEGEAVGGFG